MFKSKVEESLNHLLKRVQNESPLEVANHALTFLRSIVDAESAVFDVVSLHRTIIGKELVRSRLTNFGVNLPTITEWMPPVPSDDTISDVFERREIAVYPDLTKEAPPHWGDKTPLVKSWIACPLVISGTSVGLIIFEHSSAGKFIRFKRRNEKRTLEALCKIVAHYLDFSLCKRRDDTKRDMLKIFLSNAYIPEEQRLHESARLCSDALNCSKCRFYYLSNDRTRLVPIADNFTIGGQARIYEVNTGVFQWSIRNLEARSIPNTRDTKRAQDFTEEVSHEVIGSMVVVPMISDGDTIGVLTVDARPNYHFSRYDIQVIKATAEYALRDVEAVRSRSVNSQAVFIVHGHDDENLKRLKAIIVDHGLIPVVLRDHVKIGDNWLQEFINLASKSAFAFAIITPDDKVVSVNKGIEELFARPNVYFEVGWFYGNRGKDSICLLFKDNVSLISDWGGLVGIAFKEHIDENQNIVRSITSALRNAHLIKGSLLSV